MEETTVAKRTLEVSRHDKKKQQRLVCSRCDRPTPSACICSALPAQKLDLKRCHALVLQHPHESRHKNRSLPLVSHCINDITIVVGKRLGHSTDAQAMQLLREHPVWLVYPGQDAIPLSKALETIKPDQNITLLFLDATWKYANEMDKANQQYKQYPSDMIRVQLDASDVSTPRRFDIRTPPSEHHLSTAECIAIVIARVEDKPNIYDTVMQPLDLMVQQWNAFSATATKAARTEETRKQQLDD